MYFSNNFKGALTQIITSECKGIYALFRYDLPSLIPYILILISIYYYVKFWKSLNEFIHEEHYRKNENKPLY